MTPRTDTPAADLPTESGPTTLASLLRDLRSVELEVIEARLRAIERQNQTNPEQFGLYRQVRLNSGGPNMTIISLEGEQVKTAWFGVAEKAETATFPIACLTPVPVEVHSTKHSVVKHEDGKWFLRMDCSCGFVSEEEKFYQDDRKGNNLYAAHRTFEAHNLGVVCERLGLSFVGEACELYPGFGR